MDVSVRGYGSGWSSYRMVVPCVSLRWPGRMAADGLTRAI
jgi:hypothetical protein